jgi:hypothetical protein
VALLTSLALAVPTAMVEAGTVDAAHSALAAASGDCAVAYPVAELTVGQVVNGLTVTQGVTPTAFTGEVLGVLKDGVLPGIDMVMARLDSPTIQQVGGIWQGMSGSPVYAADGRLIGAVAFGFSFGASPVAGITPFSQMQSSLNRTALPTKVHVDDRTAALLARKTDVTRAQARQGFAQLPTPLAVSGVPSKILDRTRTRGWQPKNATVAGASPAALVPTPADIVAGGNLGVTFSTGDITQGSFGTVTSVCNGLVRGFGHPFNLLGKTTYGMSGAETLYIQEDPAGPPFTVANFGPTIGTINQDRNVGVSGPLGVLPSGATVTSVVNHGPDLRTSQTVVTVQDALAQTTNFAMVVNHLRVLDSFPPGAEVQNWAITGHDGSVPFTLRGGNRYADAVDLIGVAQWDLPDLVWALGFIPNVTIDSVTGFSTVTDDASVFRLIRAEQRVAGKWVKLDKSTPARVKAGKKLRLRLVLGNPDGNQTVPLVYRIPAKAAGQRGRLNIGPGFLFPFETGDMPTTITGMKKLLRTFIRNDQFEGRLSFFTEVGSIEKTKKTPPATRVVSGNRRIKVVVE